MDDPYRTDIFSVLLNKNQGGRYYKFAKGVTHSNSSKRSCVASNARHARVQYIILVAWVNLVST